MWICQLHQLQITLHNTCGNISWGFAACLHVYEASIRFPSSMLWCVCTMWKFHTPILQECYNLTPAHLDMLRFCYCTNSTSAAASVISWICVNMYLGQPLQNWYMQTGCVSSLLEATYLLYLYWSPPVFSSGSGHPSRVVVSCNSVCNVYEFISKCWMLSSKKGPSHCHAWPQSAANWLCLIAW